MKTLELAVLAALMTAAVPLLAAPRRCSSGLPPALSGDLFAPVECSTATKPAALLPGLPVVREGKDVKTDLKELEGRWEGSLIHALGRYAVLLTVKTGWTGRAELTLDIKELQFRERLTDRLSLVPGKPKGVYEAELTSSAAPEASLKGGAILGAAVPPEAASPGSSPPADRQAELTFANGALHRVYFAVKDKAVLRVRAFSAIPGAPLQKFEVELTKTKRESL
ncbi:MAG: hypothetical protein Q8T11_09170 [Elusimicrobiota bacterium]|nr:hypothetical protein [Elusimicrobiota bacterium]